jgi:hypothetical protein
MGIQVEVEGKVYRFRSYVIDAGIDVLDLMLDVLRMLRVRVGYDPIILSDAFSLFY